MTKKVKQNLCELRDFAIIGVWGPVGASSEELDLGYLNVKPKGVGDGIKQRIFEKLMLLCAGEKNYSFTF